MRFNPRARLDRSQVQVRRGGSGPSGAGGRRGAPRIAVGGGLGGVLLLVLVLVLNQYLGGGEQPPGSAAGPGSVQGTDLSQCASGTDANADPDCARLAVVNSVQDFWSRALPDQAGRRYVEADTVFFTGSVSTACGSAGSDVGPFYCPADRQVYLDTTFFADLLQRRLGAGGGDFAEAYVLAHEYGHHVQNLLGVMGRVRTQSGADSDAVRLELQADCLAGMWARHATGTRDDSGQVLIEELTREDVAEALDAAEAVGDDRIQRRTGGRVDPESWTHGSAGQRMRWFETGRSSGSLAACDTFAADRL